MIHKHLPNHHGCVCIGPVKSYRMLQYSKIRTRIVENGCGVPPCCSEIKGDSPRLHIQSCVAIISPGAVMQIPTLLWPVEAKRPRDLHMRFVWFCAVSLREQEPEYSLDSCLTTSTALFFSLCPDTLQGRWRKIPRRFQGNSRTIATTQGNTKGIDGIVSPMVLMSGLFPERFLNIAFGP